MDQRSTTTPRSPRLGRVTAGREEKDLMLKPREKRHLVAKTVLAQNVQFTKMRDVIHKQLHDCGMVILLFF